jgi:ribulose 1,5-bisphosphate synthetase/thiazole synthase
MLAAASFLAVATALPSQYSDFKLEEYSFTDVITRDVCIVGGGSSGTYASAYATWARAWLWWNRRTA